MKLLLDTHFLLWAVLGSGRLEAFPWLADYRPWGVSPISFLEVQFLAEAGKLEVRNPAFAERVAEDARFVVDDPPFSRLVLRALEFAWTRDPFDRLLVAHSATRRRPLCTLDRRIGRHYRFVPRELR